MLATALSATSSNRDALPLATTIHSRCDMQWLNLLEERPCCSARSFPRFASCFGGSLGRPLAVVSRQVLVSCGHTTKCYRLWYMFLVAISCVICLALWPFGVFCFSLTSISLVSAIHTNVVRGPIPAAHREVAVSVSFPR